MTSVLQKIIFQKLFPVAMCMLRSVLYVLLLVVSWDKKSSKQFRKKSDLTTTYLFLIQIHCLVKFFDFPKKFYFNICIIQFINLHTSKIRFVRSLVTLFTFANSSVLLNN